MNFSLTFSLWVDGLAGVPLCKTQDLESTCSPGLYPLLHFHDFLLAVFLL